MQYWNCNTVSQEVILNIQDRWIQPFWWADQKKFHYDKTRPGKGSQGFTKNSSSSLGHATMRKVNDGCVGHIFSRQEPLSFRYLRYLNLEGYLFVLRFYSPVNPVGSCQMWSVYLTILLLGRLSPLSGQPILCTFLRQKLTTALLESAEGREWT